MEELTALREEVAELRRQVALARRARWIAPGVAAAFAVGLAALALGAPRQDHTPTQLSPALTCKSLTLLDDAGHTMLQLGSDKDGGFLVLNGADGKKRFYVAVEGGGGFSDWYDAAGMRRATIFIGEKGNSELRLADKQEHVAAVLQQADAGGFFALRGPDDKDRLAAGVDNGGGYVDISDAAGNLRQSFYMSDKDTAQFKVLGADKSLRFLLSGNANGGQAIAYDAEGKQRATFP